MAPTDKLDWHPVWEKCHQSWKEQFPESEYKHLMWDDTAIDNLVRQYYYRYFSFYNNLPLHIMKIDFARFCILHKYGGIYADMDMYCYKNFYSDLVRDYYLVGSLCAEEVVQNSLMVSTPKNNFMQYCMNKISTNNKIHTKKVIKGSYDFEPQYVLETTGPRYLGIIFKQYGGTQANILPPEEYNLSHLTYDEKIKTRHMLTGRWGKEVIEREKKMLGDGVNYKEHSIIGYKNFRGIDIVDYDFYS